MASQIDNLIKNWQRRNILGFYSADKNEAVKKILEIIPQAASIGISGSLTLDQIEIVKHLEERGSKVFSPYKKGLSREENLAIRRQGVNADYYLASANAISGKGELVFFSAYGNRTAGISYAKNVILVCGINKLTANVSEAIKRSREYATPLNCKRINWNTPCLKDGICHNEICLFPEYKRMCCQVLIIEAEVSPDRLKVVLVGEELGY
ncbi:MAG TPA: lactate utilization protein [Candidatus Omnitrophota bacterium]|nr:lactate utilization protein [Candidatus Omnitrophota bacterium]